MFSKPVLVFLYFCNLCLVGTLLVHGSNGQERKPYIVYMGELPESTLSVSLADAHHNLLLEAIGDEKIAKESKIYSYGRSFNALASRLLPHEAEILSQKENVVSVFSSKIRRLRTTRSWGSIGMSFDVERHKGVESDLIVGVLDTGIYVPSPSFNDSGYGPPPKKWKGMCVKGKKFSGCNKDAKAWIQKTREIFNGTMISVASFSSRSPQTISRYILKPDISAPGMDILAATTKLSLFTRRDSLYKIESGTSMATPHVAGAVAYVKSFHPDWSPAAIKSALMTTAKPFEKHVIGAELASGSGQLNPTQALQPGLIYDINFESYISHLCKEGYSNKNISLLAGEKVNCTSNHIIKYANKGIDGLNYPSIHIQLLNSTTKFSAVFSRTVTYVGEGKAVFRAKILNKSPDKNTILSVIVSPNTLAFTETYEKRSFNVTIKGKFIGKEKSMYHSATLLWSDDRHTVRSPILVYREA